MKTSLTSFRDQRRGAALVLTIILLSMITILVLGMANMVRNETVSSHSHEERGRALLFANMGVDMVNGVLRHATADYLDPSRAFDATSNPARVWLSRPGALITPVESSSGVVAVADNKLSRQVDLHSGIPSAAMLAMGIPSYYQPANLNIQTLTDQSPPTYLISDQPADPTKPITLSNPAVQLQLRWIYVRKDGTLDYSEKPVLNNTVNPLVGRFAYWTDDETSKINLNTAWKRNPTNGGSTGQNNPFSSSHPTAVNLSSIPGFDADMPDLLHKAITPAGDYSDLTSFNGGRFFNSVKEVRKLDARFVNALNADKFEVTYYNHDPNTTFFGEPRIVLTTQKKYAPRDANGKILKDSKGRPYYLKIRVDPNSSDDNNNSSDSKPIWNMTDAGSVDPAAVSATVEKLNEYLQRTDWPMTNGSGKSLQSKYYAGKPERLTQLSLNILDYVRSKESAGDPSQLVIPTRGTRAATAGAVFVPVVAGQTPTDSTAYLGITRSPRMTEMGLWLNSTATSGTSYSAKAKVEIYLPKNFGLPSLDLTKLSLYTAVTLNGSTVSPESQIKVSEVALYNPGEPVTTGTSSVLKAGGYALVTRALTATMSGTRPKTVTLRYAISLSAGRLDITPLGDGALCNLDSTAIPENSVSSIEIDDLRVNSHKDDWQKRTGNSFGKVNSVSTLGKPANTSIIPQQDTDNTGKITDASLYMPPAAGATGNTRGLVESSGELGYIHTGMESGAGAGYPWRTIRLQPNNYADSQDVPDWAFMDLFTVPVDVPTLAKGVFAPHDTTAGGRVNVNAQAEPFGNSDASLRPAGTPALERRTPLVAALLGVPKDAAGTPVSATDAQTIASNIYFRTLSPPGPDGKTKGKSYGYANAYDSPGEVVEIKGVADSGEESEAVVRGLSNLICSRGGVFTVYSIGQSLQQTRKGDTLIITGEHRQQVMLERYQLPTTSTTTGSGVTSAAAPQVRFRKVSYQDLTP